MLGIYNRWTGLLDWTTGLAWWTGQGVGRIKNKTFIYSGADKDRNYGVAIALSNHACSWEEAGSVFHPVSLRIFKICIKTHFGHASIIAVYAPTNPTTPNDTTVSQAFHNTKQVQSLTIAFCGRNSRTKDRSNDKMAAMKSSLHSAQNRLCYHFAVYPTNESCSQRHLHRLMTIKSLEMPCLQITAKQFY